MRSGTSTTRKMIIHTDITNKDKKIMMHYGLAVPS